VTAARERGRDQFARSRKNSPETEHGKDGYAENQTNHSLGCLGRADAFFSSGVIAQTPNHLATDPILPFRAAAPSLPSQAQLDAQPQLSLPSDQQIRQAQSRQTEDFKKGMAKAEGGPGAGSGFFDRFRERLPISSVMHTGSR
jgi:hypothetical protein